MLGGLPRTADSLRLSIQDFPIAAIIGVACSVRRVNVIRPAWISYVRFDIEVTLPPGSSKVRNEMLRQLPTERFGITLHRKPGRNQAMPW